jgi:hypothetical protein
VPKTRWADLVSARATFCATNLPYDCRELLRFIDEAQEMLPALGYTSLDEFVQRGLRLDPALVSWAVDGLHQLKPDEPIPFDRAIRLGRQGRPTKEQQVARKGYNVTFSKRGYKRDYILARLDRDQHHQLAADVRAARLSAHAAALQAGYRRVKSPLEQLRYWWRKASTDERATFCDETKTPMPATESPT